MNYMQAIRLGDEAEEWNAGKSKRYIERIKKDDELTEKSGRKGKPFTKEDINKNLERLSQRDTS